MIIDFEGEPARPLPERRQKRSPLRDVASMLRSFAYVTSAVEILRGGGAPEDFEQRARERFLERYLEHVDSTLLPAGEAQIATLLSIFELEKAIYELQLRARQPPRLGQHPGRRDPAAAGRNDHRRSQPSSTRLSAASTPTRTPCSAPIRPTTAS